MHPAEMTFAQLCALFSYKPKGRPLGTREVAGYFGFHKVSVDRWRLDGTGPRYFNPPGTNRVFYSEEDVLRWLASGAKQSTSEGAE